jgi:transposase InsO family protein
MPAPIGGGRTKSPSVRPAILAVVSRVRCAALRDVERQSKASRKRKERKDSIVAEEISNARQTIESWRQDYNEYRPHSSLGLQTPSEFVADWQQTRTDPKAGFLTHEMVQ